MTSEIDTLPLFTDEGLRVPTPNPADTLPLTVGQRLRARQAARIATGLHPLAYGGRHLPLHPAAPRDANPDDPRPYPKCGGCVHRVLQEHHNRTYPKCDAAPGRDSASEASDVRAWWPGCVDYEPREPA